MGETDDLSVSETGSYKSLGQGPRTDTEAFGSMSEGVPDSELEAPTLDRGADSFSTGEWPTIPLNKDRRSNLPEPSILSARTLMLYAIGLVVAMVSGIAVGTVVGAMTADDPDEPTEQLEPAPHAQPDPDRIPVHEGIQ